MEVAIFLMFLVILAAFWLLPVGVALAVAWSQSRTMRGLRARIEALEKAEPRTAAPVPVAAPVPTVSPKVSEPEPPDQALEPELEPAADQAFEPEPSSEPTAPEPATAPTLAPTPTPPRKPKKSRPKKPPMALPALPSPERVAVWIAASLGGLALVLTALFALVAAVERGWLGPAARVSTGLAVGTLIWGFGAWRRADRPWASSALSGAGAATLYGSLYAGSGLYHVIPNWLASVLMIAVTAVATLRAAKTGQRFMAHIALIGGLLTPVLVSTGENHPVTFFAYLALLCAGVVAAAVKRGWWDVIGLAAIGSGLLHLSWTVTWYAADQTPYGLLGAFLLVLPFAAASASRDKPVYFAAALGGTALSALALPWLVPVDPVFYDPRSGEMVIRTSSEAALYAALAVALFPVPLWLAGRRQEHDAAGFPGAIVATVLPVAFVSTWAATEAPPGMWLAVGSVVALATGTLATLAHQKSARGLLSVPIAAGFALLVGMGSGALSGANYGPAACALVIFGLALARSAGWGWMMAPVLAGSALPLLGSAPLAQELGLTWSLAPILVAAALISQIPLVVRWESAPRIPAAVAALTGLVLLWPLHAIWKAGLGDGILGLVPLLIAGNAMLAAAVLLRNRQVGKSDPTLALFVGVVLFGISAALPMQLQERWLTVAWAIEAAALAGISSRVTNPLIRWFSLGLSVVVGVRLLANPWALEWGDATGWPILNWTLYSWGVPMVCVALVALWLPRRGDPKDPLRWTTLPLGILSLLIGFALVNVQVSHGFQDAGPIELGGHGIYQGMVRSIAWALYGLAILFAGLFGNIRALRFVGFAFVLVAAAKVFGFDLWDLSGFVRVGSIGALGVTLIVAAFLFEKLVVRGFRDAPVQPEKSP